MSISIFRKIFSILRKSFLSIRISENIHIAENFNSTAVNPSGYAPTGVTEKYYYYSDQYQDASNRGRDIIDIKHCRGGGPPNVTEQCNEQRCPGKYLVNIMIFLRQKMYVDCCIDI